MPTAVIFPDDKTLSIYQDVHTTCAKIEQFSRKDDEAYHRFHEWASPLLEMMAAAMYYLPPPLSTLVSMLEGSEDGRELNVYVVIALLEGDSDKYYNAAALLGPKGVLAKCSIARMLCVAARFSKPHRTCCT